jgi:ankyrin repeat protein
MYRLYDFHIGPSKHRQQKFNGGNLILVVHSPNKDGTFQQIQMVDDDASDDEADSNQQNKDGTSPEEEADRISLYVGDDKVILDKNTLNVPNNDGWTPLHACCHVLNATEAGCTIVHELVKKKENLNLVTKRGPGSFSCGFTPLHIACKSNSSY